MVMRWKEDGVNLAAKHAISSNFKDDFSQLATPVRIAKCSRAATPAHNGTVELTTRYSLRSAHSLPEDDDSPSR